MDGFCSLAVASLSGTDRGSVTLSKAQPRQWSERWDGDASTGHDIFQLSSPGRLMADDLQGLAQRLQSSENFSGVPAQHTTQP